MKESQSKDIKCWYCGNVIKAKRYTKRYCSMSCKMKAWRRANMPVGNIFNGGPMFKTAYVPETITPFYRSEYDDSDSG